MGYHGHSPAGLVVTGVPLARDDMYSPRATVKHTPCRYTTSSTTVTSDCQSLHDMTCSFR